MAKKCRPKSEGCHIESSCTCSACREEEEEPPKTKELEIVAKQVDLSMV